MLFRSVVVIAPPAEEAAPVAEDIDAMLRAALAARSLKDAVAAVADATGQAKREVYQRALELVKARDAEA